MSGSTSSLAATIRRVCAVVTPPGEWHWHGASPDSFMCHLAMWEDDDATWGEHVTDEEYLGAPVDLAPPADRR